MTGTQKDAIRCFLGVIACAASFVLFVCVSSCYSKNTELIKDVGTEQAVYDYYNKAIEFKKAGRLVHARILLEKAATADPTSLSAYVHQVLASVYRDLGNSNQAIREGLLSLKYNATEKDTYYIVALCLKDARRYDESIQYLSHFSGMVSGKRKEDVLEMIRQLEEEKTKLGQFSPEAVDYLDQLKSEASLHKWRRDGIPIKVHIQEVSDARGFEPAYPVLARNAFITWYQASNKRLSFEFVNDPTIAKIKVVWTDRELRSGDDAAKERTKAGLTTSQCYEDGEVNEALIQIRTVDAFARKAHSEDRIKETCLHEVGHSLGLNGHSTNNADIMYYGTNSKQLPALTKRDKATIARLYSDFPAYPMVGVDTSFPYPSPDTYVPRLTDSQEAPEQGLSAASLGGSLSGGSGGADGDNGTAATGGGASAVALPTPVQHMIVPPAKKNPLQKSPVQKIPAVQPTTAMQPPALVQPTSTMPSMPGMQGLPNYAMMNNSMPNSPMTSSMMNNSMPNNSMPNNSMPNYSQQNFSQPGYPQQQNFLQPNFGQQNYAAQPAYQGNPGSTQTWPNQQGPGSYAYGAPNNADPNASAYANQAPPTSAPAATPQNPLQYAQQLFQQFTGGGGNNIAQPQLNQQQLGQSGQQPAQFLNQMMQMFQPKR